MRPATAADRPAIEALIRARAEWLGGRGLPDWEGLDAKAPTYAAHAGTRVPVWAAIGEDTGRIAGVMGILDETPRFLWPDEAERNRPAVFLATAFTDPAYYGRRIGRLMACWALDHAHRLGRLWVRRGTGPYPRLVAYYTREQGWTLVSTVKRHGMDVHGFARRAEPQPHLPELGMRLGVHE